MAVYKCPVCEGRGFVNAGFYTNSKYDPFTVNCRSCNGKGIVFDTIEYAPKDNIKSNTTNFDNIGYFTYEDYLKGMTNNNGHDENQ